MLDTQKAPRGQLVLQTVAMPAHTNANGDIFGGWVVSKMDLAAGIASRYRSKSRSVTVAIDQLVFIVPVYIGDMVSCYAELLKVGHTSMQFHIEVWTLSLTDEHIKKAAQGLFTFVAIDENRKPQLVDRGSP